MNTPQATADFNEVWEAAKRGDYTREFEQRDAEICSNINRVFLGEADAESLQYVDKQIMYYLVRTRERQALELNNLTAYAGVVPHVATQMEVGAVLYSSWGYDQTNVDFYVVVEMSKAFVKLLPLKSEVKEGGFMSGTAHASKLVNYSEEVLRRKIKGDRVNIESFISAKLWDGKGKYNSWYA